MRLIDADELYSRLMARYTAHNLDDTRDMAGRAAIMSCMEAVERSKTITATQPDNGPLTLEQIREMGGEPVWVVPVDGKYFPKWMIVDTETEVCRNPDRSTAMFKTLGKAWNAYRRRPEGI